MAKFLRLSLILFALAFVFSSCATGTVDQSRQDFGEVVWNGDENGLIAFADRSASSVFNTSVNYELVALNGEGDITRTIESEKRSNASFSAAIFIGGGNAVTQLSEDIYSVDLSSGKLSLLSNKANLFTVSPDLRFAVLSHSPRVAPVKTIVAADLSISPAREIAQFDLKNVAATQGIWLGQGKFALTIEDSIGRHVSIYDTTGALIAKIGNAEAAFHASGFVPTKGLLYVRDRDDHMFEVSLATLEHRQVTFEKTLSFDIAEGGERGIYTTADSVGNRSMYALRFPDLSKTFIRKDIYWGKVSASGRKIAIVYPSRDYFTKVDVVASP